MQTIYFKILVVALVNCNVILQYIFQACGGTSKGITFKDLLSGLVLLTRGEESEKVKCKFIYLYLVYL